MSDRDNVNAVSVVAMKTGETGHELDPETAAVVAAAASRFLCETKSPLIRSYYYLIEMLHRYAVTPAPGAPPLIARAPAFPESRDAVAVMRSIGVSFNELQDIWRERLDSDGVNATLPTELLDAFLDPLHWRIIADFIDDGPGVATERVERLMRAEATRVIAPRRSRPNGGRISKGHLENYSKAATRLMMRLIELHHRGHASVPVLAKWTSKPRIQVPDAESGVTDTTAPPLPLLRRVWSGLDAEIARIMRVPLEEQLAAVPTLTTKQQKALFERLRKRALYTLLVCLGARLNALHRLDVRDFVRDRRLVDGSIGPAIALRPQKSLAETEVRYKPLPRGAATVIEVWLAFVELKLGHPLPPDAPLLIPTMTRWSDRWSDVSMRQCIAGASMTQKRPQYRAQPALIPKSSPNHGYTPHTLRSAVTQQIRTPAAAGWLTEHGLKDDPVFLVLIAEALTDHSDLTFDKLGYGGGRKAEDRERLSGYGTHIMWELVTTARGARRALDADGFRSALYKRTALEAELAKVRQASTELQAGEMPSKDEALAVVLRLQQLSMRQGRLDDELRVVERELTHLRHSPGRRVLVSDEVEELPVIDLDAIEREVLGGVAPHRRAALRPVRDWLTLTELAHVLDVGDATVRRWVEGRLPSAERKRPWARPDQAPVDNTLGVKRRRIAVAGVNPLLLDSELKRERLAETLARPPEGWTPQQVEAPLRVGPVVEMEAPAQPRRRHLRAVG